LELPDQMNLLYPIVSALHLMSVKVYFSVW